MNSTDQNQPTGASSSNGNTTATPKGSAVDSRGKSKGACRRKDKNRLHAPKHRILSRNLLQALADRGENIREWQRMIRALHVDCRFRISSGK